MKSKDLNKWKKNKRVIGMIKNGFGGEIMKEFAGLRPKM